MKIARIMLFVLLPLSSQLSWAGDRSVDAIFGGAIGGALGGIVGSELGGRDGAIVGAGLGAMTGAAISTQGDRDHDRGRYYVERGYRDRGDHDHRHYEGRDDFRGHGYYGDHDERNWHEHHEERHYERD